MIELGRNIGHISKVLFLKGEREDEKSQSKHSHLLNVSNEYTAVLFYVFEIFHNKKQF